MLVCWAWQWSVQVARWPQVQPNSSQVLTQREMPELLCRLSSFLAWILGNCNAEHREAQLGFPACNTICSTHTKVKKKNWNRMEKYPPMLLSGVGSSLELTTWKCPLRSEDKNLCTYKPEYLIKSSFQMGHSVTKSYHVQDICTALFFTVSGMLLDRAQLPVFAVLFPTCSSPAHKVWVWTHKAISWLPILLCLYEQFTEKLSRV